MIRRLSPMLAVAGEPFDSDEHLFEVKWDGIRALAAIDGHGRQVWGREAGDYTLRYPELEILDRLPCGTLLDGELVVFRQARPDLSAILSRHGLTSSEKIRFAARHDPVTYVVFDLLEFRGRAICAHSLADRRGRLADLLASHRGAHLALSEGVRGGGARFFAATVAQGHEGVMAKHLASRYLPGCRSRAWQKIKPVQLIPALIVGYQPAGTGFGSLLVAANYDGTLQYIGRLTSGFAHCTKEKLGPMLARRVRSTPFVTCPVKAIWVEPEFYCRVRFLQWTAGGRLRGASFAGLLASS